VSSQMDTPACRSRCRLGLGAMVIPPLSFQPQARRPARQARVAGTGQRSRLDGLARVRQRLDVLVSP
jgi:hypothetical protein